MKRRSLFMGLFGVGAASAVTPGRYFARQSSKLNCVGCGYYMIYRHELGTKKNWIECSDEDCKYYGKKFEVPLLELREIL